MEKTIREIRGDIASLRAHADKYRTLAEQRRAVDQRQIADKLMELVAAARPPPLLIYLKRACSWPILPSSFI